MKKISLFLLVLCFSVIACAQSINRNGNTFKTTTSARTSSMDTLVTKYTFENSKGKAYPIIIRKDKGWCYVWRVSKKSGKGYRQYLEDAICVAICKEMNIKFIEHQKKNTK